MTTEATTLQRDLDSFPETPALISHQFIRAVACVDEKCRVLSKHTLADSEQALFALIARWRSEGEVEGSEVREMEDLKETSHG